jgi:hypothetical protein
MAARLRFLAATFAGVLTVMFGAPAAAQSVAMIDVRPSLIWRAPAGCPDAASLRARVEQRLERSLDDVVIGIEVDVAFVPGRRAVGPALRAGRYVARVDLRAMTVANDVRTLTSKHCHELADAVAVIVTRVASDAIAKQRVAAREQDSASVRVASIASPPPRAKPRPWTVGARVSGVSGIGVIPKVGLAAELALTLRRKDMLAELAGTRWLTSAAQFHDGAPAKVDVNLDVAAARVGWRPATLPLRAWLAVEIGDMGGANLKLPSQQLESGRWIAAGAGFGVAWQITPWLRLLGTNETMLAIDRVRFTLGDGIVVYAPSPMSFRASAGLELGWH